jgi:hypothetical protein
MRKLLLAFFLSLISANAAFAQATNFGLAPTGSTQTMSVTSASSSITLNTFPGNTIVVQNTGSVVAFVKCNSSAATTDFPVQGGWGILLACSPGNAFSAITATSTTSLYVTKGLGNTALTGGGLGSGGAITIQTSDPCNSAAKSSVAINITSATTTSLVAVSGSTTVYVCGFTFTASQVATTANTLQFEYGTGAACTSPTALTGTLGSGGLTAAAPLVISGGNGDQTIFKSAASAGICALTAIGASGTFQGFLTYVQQ